MADTVKFELVSPERLLFSADVESVVVPGTEGDFGVLPGHARLISTVRPGVISVFQNGKVTDRIFVEGGFAEVTATACTVLAEHAVPVSDLQRDSALSDSGASPNLPGHPTFGWHPGGLGAGHVSSVVARRR